MPNTLADASTTPAASRLALSILPPAPSNPRSAPCPPTANASAASTSPRASATRPSPRLSRRRPSQPSTHGHNIYTRCDGIARLRNAIAAKQQRDYGLRYDPETEVLVACGATAGLHAAAMALLNPGDEVLLFEPFYGYHVATLNSMRVKPVLVPLAEPDWALDVDALRAAVTPRTRAILLNTPANPSGKVFTLPETRSRRPALLEHDLFLLTDEIYEYFVYDGARHICPATLPGMRERTIVISGFSKTFSDHRLAPRLRDRRRALDGRHGLLPRPHLRLRAVGLPAWRSRRPRAASARLLHADRRRPPVQARAHRSAPLRDAGMEPTVPAGAYYVLAQRPHLPGKTAAQKPAILLAATGVAAVAGSAFFRPGRGEDLLRFCFAKKDEDLDDACERLRKL